jgi:hypothetical protein
VTLYIHLRIVGALLMLLGVSHFFFDRYFGWRKELASVSLFTREVFFVHTFFIGIGVMLAGAVSFLYAGVLLEPSALSRAILLGMSIFWLCRLLAQWFAYNAAIWRGNRFRTVMHVAFSALWIYVTATYGSALWNVWVKS